MSNHRTRTSLSLVVGLSLLCLLMLTWGCEEQDSRLGHVTGIETTLTGANFESDVTDSTLPVLVDFGATWCGPCRKMEPHLALFSVEYEGRVRVGKVDVDEQRELAARFDIDGYPTLVLFQDGREIGREVGFMSYQSIVNWVERHVGE